MTDIIAHHLAIAFPFFFVTLWMTITTLLGALSGWYRLMRAFPDQPAEPVLCLRGQTGAMRAST